MRLRSSRQFQTGLTLVELMIAVTLGLFLTGMTIQIFVSQKESYRFNAGFSEVQEIGRFTLDLLANELRNAGYRDNPELKVFSPLATALAGTNDVGGLDNTDTFTVSYEGGPDIAGVPNRTDCLGNPVPLGAFVTNNFSIQNGANGRPALFCNNVELIEGVEDLQLQYGIDTDGDGMANRYVTADVADMSIVVSVRIAVLVATVDQVGADYEAAQVNIFENANDVAADQRLRRVFSKVVMLRNSLGGRD